MKRQPRIGFLPLYLELYDKILPEKRVELEAFVKQVVSLLVQENLEVVESPVCRVSSEFDAAIAYFQSKDVDLIATLHLAYSPSLESAGYLYQVDLPLLIIDTTMDFDFGQEVDPSRIFYNHGVHGVQDLASVLRRKGRQFEIVAGHITESDVIGRAAQIARAAYAARTFRDSRVLRIGESFVGMGDFAVDESLLAEKFNIMVDEIEPADLDVYVKEVSDEEIGEEISRNEDRFRCDIPDAVHERSVRVCLGLRKCLDEKYGAFSMNFLAFTSRDSLVNVVPFLEASNAMERGIGYAGEGDVLTASLVGSLSRAFGKTTFTEIFCPDWKGNSLFLSHMGEMNPEVAASRPLLFEKDYTFSDAENPAVIACAPASGPATLVNLSPGPNKTFRLIVSFVNVLEDSKNEAFERTVRGWIQPECDLALLASRRSWPAEPGG